MMTPTEMLPTTEESVVFTVPRQLAERIDRLAERGDMTAKKGVAAMLEAYVDMMEWGMETAERLGLTDKGQASD